MSEAKEKRLINKEAWPLGPIEANSHINDHTWGYLYFNSDGSCRFSMELCPSREEIVSRWGYKLRH